MQLTAKGKIEKNAIILILSEVLVKVIGLSITIAVARMLGVEDFGLLAYAYALAGICLVVPDFGFNRLTVRELSRRTSRASRFLVNISAFKAILYLPAAATCTFIVFFNSQDYSRLLVVMVVFLVLATQNHMLFACSFFRAIQKMEREGMVRLTLAALSLLTGIAVLFMGFGLKALVVSRLAVSVLCLFLSILFLHRDLGVSLVKVSWRYSKTLIAMSTPLAIFTIFVTVYSFLNVVILGFIKGDIETGYYTAGLKIITLFSIVSRGLAEASLPALSKYWREDSIAFQQASQKSMRHLLLLAIPLAAGVFLLGGKAIILFFGTEFIPSVYVIKILAFSLIPDFLNTILAAILISMNREKVAMEATGVGAVIALGFCIMLIPRWGAVGAAYAWLTAETVVFFFQFCALYHRFGVAKQLVTAFRATLAAGLMGVVLICLIRIGIPIPFLVGLSIPVYAGALLALGEVKITEVKFAMEVLQEQAQSLLRIGIFHERSK